MAEMHEQNTDRAAAARDALERFRESSPGDPLTSSEAVLEAVGDLICNLLHLVEEQGGDPLKVATVGVAGYMQEAVEPDGMFLDTSVEIEARGRGQGPDTHWHFWTPTQYKAWRDQATIMRGGVPKP